jgi:hypothetical protein
MLFLGLRFLVFPLCFFFNFAWWLLLHFLLLNNNINMKALTLIPKTYIDMSTRYIFNFFRRKSSISHQAKRRKEGKPEPEEREGMPQHQHCPLAKHRGDRNPKYHDQH